MTKLRALASLALKVLACSKLGEVFLPKTFHNPCLAYVGLVCVAGLNAQVDGAQDGERRGVVTECGAVLQHPPRRRQAVQAPASPFLQPQQQGERGGQYTYCRFCS